MMYNYQAHISVTGITGRVIYANTFNRHLHISIADLQSDLYFVEVVSDG